MGISKHIRLTDTYDKVVQQLCPNRIVVAENDKKVKGAICRQVGGCITKSKNNVIENGHCTVQKIKTRWDQAGIETIQDIAICTKVVKLWEKYRDVKKKKERVTKGAIEERESFERELGKCFNISAKNAIQTIPNDKNRSSHAKEIDIIFLGDQLTNLVK